MLLRISPISTPAQRISCVLLNASYLGGLAFLLLPLIIIIPLSFNAETYFTFTDKMLALDSSGYSTRWYRQVLTDPQWTLALRNSLVVGAAATVLATTLGTMAALGLHRGKIRGLTTIAALLQTPLIAPIIVVAAAMYLLLADLGLTQTLAGIVIAHVVLGSPLVVSTVLATLSSFDSTLIKASMSLGASPFQTFRKITIPIIWPGIVSGALFAFIASLDEVVVVLFVAGSDQRTLPRQMWSGLREQLSPAILAAATLLMVTTILLIGALELLRWRANRLGGALVAGKVDDDRL